MPFLFNILPEEAYLFIPNKADEEFFLPTLKLITDFFKPEGG